MTLKKTTHTTDDSDDIIILIGQSGAMFASLHPTAYELIKVKIRRLTSDLSMTILHQSLTSEVSRGSKWLPADLNQTIGGARVRARGRVVSERQAEEGKRWAYIAGWCKAEIISIFLRGPEGPEDLQ